VVSGGKTADPASLRGSAAAREEMQVMLNEVKPKALRERLLKVWAKL
jgi:hypothetical protein